MDFLKKHYEKVLLGVVLLGLAVAVAFLPFKIASEKQKLEDLRNQLIHPNVKALTNADLAGPDSMLQKMAAPAVVDFSVPNKLFNPMPWQKTPDGALIKVNATNIGPNALIITNRKELCLVITLDDVTVTEAGGRYRIGVKRKLHPIPKNGPRLKSTANLATRTTPSPCARRKPRRTIRPTSL
jgi:hypothetical protein